MDEQKAAERIRGINWERWMRDILDWRWWMVTVVIAVLIWPPLFVPVMIMIGFSIARSLKVMSGRKDAKDIAKETDEANKS